MPSKSRQLWPIELRDRMWPAGVEPAARRVSGGRSTGLSYGHVRDGRGWTRTSSLLCVRQALCAIELLARTSTKAPGRGVEPRPPRPERGVLPVRRSRNEERSDALRPPRRTRSTQRRGARVLELCHVRPKPNDVVQATRLPFDPGSPRYDVLRGGALEPDARAVSVNVQAKAAAYSAANSAAPKAQEDLSL